MEVDDGATTSSDEEMSGNPSDINRPHTAEIKIDMDTPEAANIVCRTVKVDREPTRSNAVRSVTVDGKHLIISISSVDRKSLQKSIANFFDMCDLAKSTIDLVQKKSWISGAPASKKPRLVE